MTFGNAADYLPHKPVREFERHEVIYDAQHPSRDLYMVVVGRVKVTNLSLDGTQTIVRIAGREAMFGESALIQPVGCHEVAMALDRVAVMAWSTDEVERHIERVPMLGMALSRYFVMQSIELQQRIVGMSAYGIPKRVALSMLQLAETLGTPREDGSRRIGSLTQNTIAEFVGTSREMLSLEMNRLRRLGMIRYCRQFIDVYTQALSASLREDELETHRAPSRGLRRAAG